MVLPLSLNSLLFLCLCSDGNVSAGTWYSYGNNNNLIPQRRQERAGFACWDDVLPQELRNLQAVRPVS